MTTELKPDPTLVFVQSNCEEMNATNIQTYFYVIL